MNASKAIAIQQIIDPDYLIDIIQENFEPEDVFTTLQLEEWATDNGFIKVENE